MWSIVLQRGRGEARTTNISQKGLTQPPFRERDEDRPKPIGHTSGQLEHLPLGATEESRGRQVNDNHLLRAATSLVVVPKLQLGNQADTVFLSINDQTEFSESRERNRPRLSHFSPGAFCNVMGGNDNRRRM